MGGQGEMSNLMTEYCDSQVVEKQLVVYRTSFGGTILVEKGLQPIYRPNWFVSHFEPSDMMTLDKKNDFHPEHRLTH